MDLADLDVVLKYYDAVVMSERRAPKDVPLQKQISIDDIMNEYDARLFASQHRTKEQRHWRFDDLEDAHMPDSSSAPVAHKPDSSSAPVAHKKRPSFIKVQTRKSRAGAFVESPLSKLKVRGFQDPFAWSKPPSIHKKTDAEWDEEFRMGVDSGWDYNRLRQWLQLLAGADARGANDDIRRMITEKVIEGLEYWTNTGIDDRLTASPLRTAADIEDFEMSPAGQIIAHIASVAPPVRGEAFMTALENVHGVALKALGPVLNSWCSLMMSKGKTSAHDALDVYAYGVASRALGRLGIVQKAASRTHCTTNAWLKWLRALKGVNGDGSECVLLFAGESAGFKRDDAELVDLKQKVDCQMQDPDPMQIRALAAIRSSAHVSADATLRSTVFDELAYIPSIVI